MNPFLSMMKTVVKLAERDSKSDPEAPSMVRLAPFRGGMGRATYNVKKNQTTVAMVVQGNMVGPLVRGEVMGGLLVVDRQAYQAALAEEGASE